MARNGIKTGGRKKGSLNKDTKHLRTWLNDFMIKNTAQIELDWEDLDPKDRVLLFEKFLKYSLPSLQSVSGEIQVENLDDVQLDNLYNKIISTANGTTEED